MTDQFAAGAGSTRSAFGGRNARLNTSSTFGMRDSS
jgi:hypothetical protein